MKKTSEIIDELNRGWEFRGLDDGKWYPANIPGSIHLDLLNNNLIPDPFFGKNESKLQWISDKDWTYRLVFKIDEKILGKTNKTLLFHGLDTYANVFLNGEKIISANNMFHPWEVGISNHLLSGLNELVVSFRSPIKEILPILADLGYELPAENDQAGKTSPFTRKAPYNYGWDWGPCLVTSGIWKKVEIIGWDDWRVLNAVISNKKVTNKLAEVSIEMDIISNIKDSLFVSVKESRTGKYKDHYFDLVEGEQTIQYVFTIENPELWWPVGHGEQILHEFKINIEGENVGTLIEKRLGLRDVKIHREKDGRGESFEIHINNRPIFSKGANWIPADSFVNRIGYGGYERLLNDALKANMNTLRIWGGGIYEPDAFYELCDEKGIMVWQDFMFACSMYPANPDFLFSVKKEVSHQIKRLKGYSCIILWCGNNEVASGWLSWGWKEKLPVSVWQDYGTLFHDLLPKICNELDSERLYWPSSPGHSLQKPKDDQIYGQGDNHYWGVWHGGDGFDAFEKNVGRFMSEYGMQSFPDIKTIKSFTIDKDRTIDSDVMNAHQKASLGTVNLVKYVEDYYKMNEDFTSFITLSQIMQAEAMRFAVESHRRSMPFCMGTLYWQFNDCWPVISWSSIDYRGNWKALQYAAKRFFSPVLLSIFENKELIEIHVINDEYVDYPCTLSLLMIDLEGTVMMSEQSSIKIKPFDSTIVKKFNKKDLIGKNKPSELYFKSELRYNDRLISEADFLFCRPKELNIQKPKFEYDVKKSDDKYLLNIESKSLCFQVHAQSSITGVFSKNFFTLLPGDKISLEFEPYDSVSDCDEEISFEIKTLYELMN